MYNSKILIVLIILVPLAQYNTESTSTQNIRINSNRNGGTKSGCKTEAKHSISCNSTGCQVSCFAKSRKYLGLPDIDISIDDPKIRISASQGCQLTGRRKRMVEKKCRGKRAQMGHKIMFRQVTQDFEQDAVDDLNKLAEKLIRYSFNYVSMAMLYSRAETYLPGFAKLMTDLAKKDYDHAMSLFKYNIARGGFVDFKLTDVSSKMYKQLNHKGTRKTGYEGIKRSLEESKDILKDVNELVHKDYGPHMRHYLQDGLMEEKIELIKQLADILFRLKDHDPILLDVVDTELLG